MMRLFYHRARFSARSTSRETCDNAPHCREGNGALVTDAVLYKGGTCAGIRQWTTPIAVKGHIVFGGDGHLCSWSPQ